MLRREALREERRHPRDDLLRRLHRPGQHEPERQRDHAASTAIPPQSASDQWNARLTLVSRQREGAGEECEGHEEDGREHRDVAASLMR